MDVQNLVCRASRYLPPIWAAIESRDVAIPMIVDYFDFGKMVQVYNPSDIALRRLLVFQLTRASWVSVYGPSLDIG